MDASVNMLPYVYDTFKWDHCLGAGIDFDDAWVTPSSDMAKKSSTGGPTSKKNEPSLGESGAARSGSSFHRGTKRAGGGAGGREAG